MTSALDAHRCGDQNKALVAHALVHGNGVGRPRLKPRYSLNSTSEHRGVFLTYNPACNAFHGTSCMARMGRITHALMHGRTIPVMRHKLARRAATKIHLIIYLPSNHITTRLHKQETTLRLMCISVWSVDRL